MDLGGKTAHPQTPRAHGAAAGGPEPSVADSATSPSMAGSHRTRRAVAQSQAASRYKKHQGSRLTPLPPLRPSPCSCGHIWGEPRVRAWWKLGGSERPRVERRSAPSVGEASNTCIRWRFDRCVQEFLAVVRVLPWG